MGYLDEAGLAALVGKVKGQMVELTAEEYAQIDPAIKNYDNKLYFVKNDVAGYQIDNEPVANSNGLVRSGGIYNWTSKIGSGTLTTTAQTLIPAVNEVNAKIGYTVNAMNEVNAKIGSTDISSIGDGTVTGAVNALNNGLEMHYRNYEALENEYATVDSSVVDTSQGYTVEIWNRDTEAYVQVSFNLKTAVNNNTTAVVLNFTNAITDLIHPTYRVFPGFIETGTYAGRSCVLHLDTWSDTKTLDMYNGLGGAIAAGTRMTFAFYVMQ